jgi:hypothetical protein
LNSRNREIESVNSSIISVPQGQEIQRKKSINTDIHNQITADDSEKKCCGCWKNNVHKTKEDDWGKYDSCRN